VAHHGASARAPENTLAALAAAVADGADLVGFDVRRTQDGVLVLLHDETLDRTTDARLVYPRRAPGRVADFTLAELGRLDAGSWKDTGSAGERVPTLTEAMDLVRPGGVGTLIEIKVGPGDRAPIAELTASSAAVPTWRAPRCSRSTPPACGRCASRCPRWPSLSSAAPHARIFARCPDGVDQVHPPHRQVDRRLVDEVHGWGMRCLVWTVNRPSCMHRVIALGVDGVIIDHPDLLRDHTV